MKVEITQFPDGFRLNSVFSLLNLTDFLQAPYSTWQHQV